MDDNSKKVFVETIGTINEAIFRALQVIGLEVERDEIHLEHPALRPAQGKQEHGDYSTNVAMELWGRFNKMNEEGKLKSHDLAPIDMPRKLADYIVDLLKKDKRLEDLIEKIEVAGAGFINFWLKKEYLVSELGIIVKEKNDYGKSDVMKGRKIMVEYAHPNTHKELHIGHMRTLITGEALARILEFSGAKVFRANYQGDIGPHVAKAIWGTLELLEEKGLNWEQAEQMTNLEKAHLLGEGYVLANQQYDDHKSEIDRLNTSLYEHQSEVEGIYQKTKKWSLDYYEDFYKRFGTKFDRLYFESQVAEQGKKTVLDHVGKVFEESDGAVIFNGEKYGLHKRVFITKDGNPTYEGKDIGLAPKQFKDFPFDLNIHVVANEQTGYFQVVFKALELIDKKFKDREYHLSMGMVNLVGMKISSRTGVLVTVDQLLDEVKQLIKSVMQSEELDREQVEEIAEAVTLGAVKYSILKINPGMNVAFDLKKSVDLKGDSGPYLQYTYARTQSVLEKSNIKNQISKIQIKYQKEQESDFDLNIEELDVLRWVYRFPEVVLKVAQDYAPNLICGYLHELAQRYNAFYNQHRILQAETEEQKQFRLLMNKAVGQVLQNGLNLLGIEAPDKM